MIAFISIALVLLFVILAGLCYQTDCERMAATARALAAEKEKGKANLDAIILREDLEKAQEALLQKTKLCEAFERAVGSYRTRYQERSSELAKLQDAYNVACREREELACRNRALDAERSRFGRVYKQAEAEAGMLRSLNADLVQINDQIKVHFNDRIKRGLTLMLAVADVFGPKNVFENCPPSRNDNENLSVPAGAD